MNAIEVDHISKIYKSSENKLNYIKSILFKKPILERTVLDDICLTIKSNVSYGIVGNNGSGKSTLLRIINGTTFPSSGAIKVNGEVSLLNVSAGIIDSYTGLENIEYKCTIQGMNLEQIDNKINSIIEFSELAEYIHEPVSTYSSGMKAKLGFAIAVHIDPDILIIDEALSVGDIQFSRKCLKKLDEIKQTSTTVIFVSHSGHQVRTFCDRCCWIHQGKLIAYGESSDIVDLYEDYMNNYISLGTALEIVEKRKHIYRNDKYED